MRGLGVLLFCWFFLGAPIPLRADEPAADLSDLSAWATNQLGEGFSCKPETLWGDLSYLRVTRDDAPVGLVYESIDRSGCGSCLYSDSGIAVVTDDRSATIKGKEVMNMRVLGAFSR